MSEVEEITLDAVYAEEKVEPEVVTEEVVAEEPEVEAEAETPEVETTAAEPEKSWTFSQAMDERDKRQAAVKENEELKAKLAEFDKPKDDISMFEDEKGYTEQQDEKVAIAVNAASLGMSRAYAVREFGEEKVAIAEKWYADEGMKSPHAIDRVHKSDLKFHEAVNLYEEELGRRDTEGLEAKVEARIRAEFEAKYGKESEEPREPITPSLASQRSAGKTKEKPSDWGDILDE